MRAGSRNVPRFRPYWLSQRAFALVKQVLHATWRVRGDERYCERMSDRDWYVRAHIFTRAKLATGATTNGALEHRLLRNELATMVREIRAAHRGQYGTEPCSIIMNAPKS